jgi:glycosyltransferase involved in cell wall biosynthesis
MPIVDNTQVVKVTKKEQDVNLYNNAMYTGPDPKLDAVEYAKLLTLHNKYNGKRIFIMGNGPSLNKMDLELLDTDFIFCLNRISLLLERVTWTPTFYAAFDLTVVPDNLDEFNGLDIPFKFFATKHKGAILERDNHYWYHDNSRPGELSNRFESLSGMTGFGGGGTVATLAIQLAYYMGFDPIILIGCDASYTVSKTVTQAGPDQFKDGTKLFLESTDDDDNNHFDPRYFGKGKKWHNPNVAEMHRGFDECYKVIKSAGRTMVNATEGGALECLPRCSFSNLFLKKHKSFKVGIDLTQNIAEISTGMRNYLLETIANMDLFNIDFEIFLFCTEKNKNVFREIRSICAKVLVVGNSDFENVLKALDCIHHPFNSVDTNLVLPSNIRRVVSVHDLIPFTQPGFPDSIKKTYSDAVKKADAVVCLSNPIKKLVCKEFDLATSKCFISNPYVGDSLFIDEVCESDFNKNLVDKIAKVKQKFKLRFPFVFYPAAFRPHKNHDKLLNAMRYVYTNLHLVLTTGETHDDTRTKSLINKIKDMNLQHRVHVLGHVEKDDFYTLYKGSIAVVYPSLDEGFGIPASEAQALGVPLVASRCGSLEEVAIGSLELDPYDVSNIADKINEINIDLDLREKVKQDGITNSKRYTKEAGAFGLLSAYIEAVNVK